MNSIARKRPAQKLRYLRLTDSAEFSQGVVKSVKTYTTTLGAFHPQTALLQQLLHVSPKRILHSLPQRNELYLESEKTFGPHLPSAAVLRMLIDSAAQHIHPYPI